jgi:hypothetical protein
MKNKIVEYSENILTSHIRFYAVIRRNDSEVVAIVKNDDIYKIDYDLNLIMPLGTYQEYKRAMEETIRNLELGR